VRKPILAAAELIWNAVDADANRVDVILHDDALGGLSSIEVADNGHGIPYAEAEDLFSRFGGSWKQGGHRSHEQRRILHGKEGRGRFRAFALGLEDLAAKGREVELDEPVKRADGSRGIIDLMFSPNIQLAGSEDREHLVVELKRPDVKIDSDVASQIESYAFAVADDERFRAVPAKWVFWAVSSDIDQNVARKVNQKDRPRGILFQDDEQRITIWVKTWSQIINDCKSRLRFFAEKLKYAPDRDSSLQHLKTTYHKYLADLFAPKVEEADNAKAVEPQPSAGDSTLIPRLDVRVAQGRKSSAGR